MFPHLADGVDPDWFRVRVEESPEIAWRMVVDLFDSAQRELERDRGTVRIGRRPRMDAVGAERMLEVVFPEHFSIKPYPDALADLIGDRSQRQFARRVPCDQSSLSRFLSGTIEPTVDTFEKLAAAAGRQPYYFLEWRANYLGQLLTQAYLRDPRRSSAMIRSMGERMRGRLTTVRNDGTGI